MEDHKVMVIICYRKKHVIVDNPIFNKILTKMVGGLS